MDTSVYDIVSRMKSPHKAGNTIAGTQVNPLVWNVTACAKNHGGSDTAIAIDEDLCI